MKKTLLMILALLALCTLPLRARDAVEKKISEFLRMSNKDTTYCQLKGVIVRVRNYDRGNVYIKDASGTVFIYGFWDSEKRHMKELDIRKGDTLTVAGYRSLYGDVIEMKYADYVSHSKGPDHDNMPIMDELDKEPSFKGKGTKEFGAWVSANLVFPSELRGTYASGTVKVKFVVGRDGKIYEPEILSSPHPAFSAEVLRVLGKSPKWKPGIVNKNPVRVTYTLPVEFVNNN